MERFACDVGEQFRHRFVVFHAAKRLLRHTSSWIFDLNLLLSELGQMHWISHLSLVLVSHETWRSNYADPWPTTLTRSWLTKSLNVWTSVDLLNPSVSVISNLWRYYCTAPLCLQVQSGPRGRLSTVSSSLSSFNSLTMEAMAIFRFTFDSTMTIDKPSLLSLKPKSPHDIIPLTS